MTYPSRCGSASASIPVLPSSAKWVTAPRSRSRRSATPSIPRAASKRSPRPTPASLSSPKPSHSAPASISGMLPATRSRSAAGSSGWWCARSRARGISRFWSVEDEGRPRAWQHSKRPERPSRRTMERLLRASRLSAVLGEALIRLPHRLLAIGALEAANGKVASRHLLEMLDERVIHGSAAERADERNSLSRELLRDHQSETGCDLGDEAHENWAAFLDDAALDDESRSLRYAFCQHAAHGKISALGSIGRTGPSAQCEYLHARERRFRIGQIFAFAARNFRNRPQHEDGRERQLDGERRQTEGAASGAGGGSQGLVQALRSRARRLVHAP